MNFKFLLPLAALAVLATACGEEFKFGGDSPASIELGIDAVDFPAEGGDAKVAVFSQGSWKAETEFDWISAERAGDSLQLSVSPNPDIYWRSGNVKVSSGNTELLVEVHQEALGLVFGLATNKLEFDCEAVDSTVAINSNVEFTVQAPEWVQATVSEAGLSLSLDRNFSLQARVADIYFIHGEEIIGSLRVSQDGIPLELSLDKNSVSAKSDKDTLSFTVSATEEWSLSGLPTWITADKTSGVAGSTLVTLYVEANPGSDRCATLTVTCYTKTAKITVNQASSAMPVKIVFSDGSTAYKKVLTPNLFGSMADGYNLGRDTVYLTSDPSYVMELYSRGATRIAGTSYGLRVRVDPGTYPTTNQIREEDFAYVKFPGIEGKKLIAIKVKCQRDNNQQVYVGSACGPTNAAAIASSVTDTSPTINTGETTFTVKNPQVNTPYYLLMFNTGWEYRFLEITIDYVSAE